MWKVVKVDDLGARFANSRNKLTPPSHQPDFHETSEVPYATINHRNHRLFFSLVPLLRKVTHTTHIEYCLNVSIISHRNLSLSLQILCIVVWESAHKNSHIGISHQWIFFFTTTASWQHLKNTKIDTGTPPKINIEPENDGWEDDFPFPGGPYSQVPAINLQGCIDHSRNLWSILSSNQEFSSHQFLEIDLRGSRTCRFRHLKASIFFWRWGGGENPREYRGRCMYIYIWYIYNNVHFISYLLSAPWKKIWRHFSCLFIFM